VTQIVLRAALAARDAALDREDLAASEKTAIPRAGHNGTARHDFGRGDEILAPHRRGWARAASAGLV